MSKLDNLNIVHEASRAVIGYISYTGSRDKEKWQAFRTMAGISRGQWKRFQQSKKLKVSELTIKKLEVMAQHGKSSHLMTLLKMVEAQMEVSADG